VTPALVDQDDGRAEFRGDPVHRGLHLPRVTDVGPDRERTPAVCLDRGHRVLRVGLLQIEHRDGEPVSGQPLRGGSADAAGRSGDDRDAVHQDTRSNRAARPWPPPMHIVSRPYRASRRSISRSSVARMRPPVAPTG
jgi:hypothetical protein